MARAKKASLTEKQIMDEIKALSEKASETSSKQLDLISGVDLGDEDIDTGFDATRLQGTANPDESWRLYYTMRRTMIDNLPKGKRNLKLRKYIYNEKSLFLNRGNDVDENGIKHSDERMTYIDNYLITALDIVIQWVKMGANPFDLYMAFYNLNEEKGYHKQEKAESEQGDVLDDNLNASPNVPPSKKGKDKKK